MNLSTETSLHRNNTSTIQTRRIPKKKTKQTHNKKKIKHQHKYSWKWSSKHEIWGEEIRTHTFFLKIWRWTNAKMEFVESDTECLDEFQLREKVNSHKKFKGKLKKFFFLNWPTFSQTRVFRDWGESPTSCQDKSSKHLKKKLWKNFLSVFRDSKVYSRVSCELSRENLCVPLAIGPFTREQVAKINTQACGCSMQLGWPATESPKQGNTVLEIFQFL